MPVSKPEIVMSDFSHLAVVTTQVRYSWKIKRVLHLLVKADCYFISKPIGHIAYSEDDLVPVTEFTYPAKLQKEVEKIAATKLLECHEIDYDQALNEIVAGFRTSLEDDTSAMEDTINEGNYPMSWYDWEEAKDAEFAYAEIYEGSPEIVRVFWAKTRDKGEQDLIVV